MPEIIMTKPDDITKLAGWQIVDAQVIRPNTSELPFIRMKIAHPFAQREVNLDIKATVKMTVEALNIKVRPDLRIEATDVEG